MKIKSFYKSIIIASIFIICYMIVIPLLYHIIDILFGRIGTGVFFTVSMMTSILVFASLILKIKENQMKTLHLTLEKKWFDIIASGEKKEEYREIKSYWEGRLCHPFYPVIRQFRNYEVIKFKNGYGKNAPVLTVEFKGIEIGTGKQEWGAPDCPVFIIKLGNILTHKVNS